MYSQNLFRRFAFDTLNDLHAASMKANEVAYIVDQNAWYASDGTKNIRITDDRYSFVDGQLNFVTSEPAAPVVGERYVSLVAGNSSATAQAVVANSILEWNGTDWTEQVSVDGLVTYDKTANTIYLFDGASWGPISASVVATLLDSSGGADTGMLPAATGSGSVIFFANKDVQSNPATRSPQLGEKINGVVDQVFNFHNEADGTQYRATDVNVGEWTIAVDGADSTSPLERLFVSEVSASSIQQITGSGGGVANVVTAASRKIDLSTPTESNMTGNITVDAGLNRINIAKSGYFSINASVAIEIDSNKSFLQLVKNDTSVISVSIIRDDANNQSKNFTVLWAGDVVAGDFFDLRHDQDSANNSEVQNYQISILEQSSTESVLAGMLQVEDTPYFKLDLLGVTSIPSGVDTQITGFTATDATVGVIVSDAFVAPSDGFYNFAAGARLEYGGQLPQEAFIYIGSSSGQGFRGGFAMSGDEGSSADYHYATASGGMWCSVGDVVAVTVRHDIGSAQNLSSFNSGTYFTGFKASPKEVLFPDAVDVEDTAYAASWDGNTNVATKNAIYDKIETLSVVSLTDGNILVGDASNEAADVSMSGEATIDNTGAVALDNDSVIGKLMTGYTPASGNPVATDSILQAIQKIDGNVDGNTSVLGVSQGDSSLPNFSGTTISDGQNVAGALQEIETSLEGKVGDSLTSGNFWLGNGSNVPAEAILSGEATMSNLGVITLNNNSVLGKTLPSYVPLNADIANGDTILNVAQKTGYTLDAIYSTLGVANRSLTMGSFTGTTLSSNQTVAFLLQELETAVESKASSTLTDGRIYVGNGSNVATGRTPGGEVTMDNNGSFTLANAAVIAKVLTGYTAGSGDVTAADSIRFAIQKLDGNIDAINTAMGIAQGATDMGTFTGSTITANSTLRVALQELETAVEAAGTTALADGDIFIGNGSNVATAQTLSGEVTITNTGVATVTNASVIAKVLTGYSAGAGTVAATDSVLAAIQKIDGNVAAINALASANLYVGNGSGVATAVAMSGEATMDNTGAVTLANASVIAKVLTGYTAGAGTVAATDTILQAIQKVDGNVAALNTLADGSIYVGNGSNAATAVAVSGEATIANTGAVTLDNASVIGKVLTGLSVATATDVVAADTLLVAIGKLQAQLDALGASVVLKGDWDASAGTFPGAGAALAGYSYIISVAGTVDSVDFSVGDRIVAITDSASTGTYASNWLKLDYTDQVLSVNGQTGAAVLNTSHVSEVTNLYFTEARVLATTLTGFVAAAGSITAADTVETAFEKLVGTQNNILSWAGLSFGSSSLPTFSGSIIPDNTTLTNALQQLETTIEANDLTTLADTNVFVGNGSNAATAVAISGDATLANTGALTLVNASVTGQAITGFTSGAGAIAATDTILEAIQKLDGNIAAVGLPALASTNIWVGNGSNAATAVAASGDVTLANTGAFSLVNASVTGQAITGFTSGAGTVAATDTILESIQKLDGNIGAVKTIYSDDDALAANRSIDMDNKTLTLDAGANTSSKLRLTSTHASTIMEINVGTYTTNFYGNTSGGFDIIKNSDFSNTSYGADGISFFEPFGSGGNRVSLKTPTTGIASNFDLFLPTADGTSGQAIVTDGSGALSFATVGMTALPDTEIFVGNGSNVATAVALSGEATIANTGAITLGTTAVTGKLITGFTSGAGTVAATDSILGAIEKLDGNIGAIKTIYTDDDALTANRSIDLDNKTLTLDAGANTSSKLRLTSTHASTIMEINVGTYTTNFYGNTSGGFDIIKNADFSNTSYGADGISFFEPFGSGGNRVSLKTPTTGIASNFDLFLPVADGAAGEGMITDGSGALSFGNPLGANYEAAFVVGDWVAGTPNTLTVTAATHGLGTGKKHVTVFDASDNNIGVSYNVAANGNVVVSSVAAPFAGTILISR